MQQEILTLFRAAEAAGPRGSDELFTALYAELHRLAERQLRRGGSEVSLSATTLLHEAYLDIAELRGVSERTVQRNWRKARPHPTKVVEQRVPVTRARTDLRHCHIVELVIAEGRAGMTDRALGCETTSARLRAGAA